MQNLIKNSEFIRDISNNSTSKNSLRSPHVPPELGGISAMESLDNLKQQGENYCSNMGFRYMSYIGYFPIGENTHSFCNFPKQWVQNDNSQRNHLKTLVSLQAQQHTSPFFWEDVCTDSKKAAQQLEKLLSDLEHENIFNGICVPIHGAGAEWGMLNVARDQKNEIACDDTLRALQLFAIGVHEKVKHYNACNTNKLSRIKALSPRERECLDWIAAGKTAWETAKIVGITESTVSFHIRNTIQKLNASNRAHAVAVAMACSLISSTTRLDNQL